MSVVDGAPFIIVDFDLGPVDPADLQAFTLEDDVITDTLPSHAVLVSVRSDWNTSTFANDPNLLGILNGIDRRLMVTRAQASWWKGFLTIFHLGTRHIAEGTDHILFLLALLLPAPLLVRDRRWGGFAGVKHGVTQILRVVTAFTIGHSITLALASTGVVHVSSKPIETLIAVSILVSAAHAIRPLFPGREGIVAGCFGFVHGLAFATTLAELGLRGRELAFSIVSFNLGIEAMQLLIILMVMPSLMLLSTTRLYPTFRRSGGILASLAASGWVIERTFNLHLGVDRVIDLLAAHALLLAAALFVLSLISYTCEGLRASRTASHNR